MARLLSTAIGNLSAAATWKVVDNGSVNDTEAATTVIGTGNSDSANFAPGAITIDGIALRVAARATSPAGTFTLTLRNSTDGVDVTSVTINVSDLEACGTTNKEGGWNFFKFSSPQTLLAGKNYITRCVCSNSGSQVTLYTSAGTTHARLLRTTTTQAPVASDILYIIGELTGQGTGNSFTVTMDDTASTQFAAVLIGKRGTLSFGVSASTAYTFRLAGTLTIYAGGTFTIGTVASPMPSTSSGDLLFNCASNVQYGMEIRGGTFVAQGASMSAVRALLAADASGGATSLTTNVNTGWKNGNTIGIANTDRPGSNLTESKVLAADASGTTLTISALSNAHSGTAPIQAELINLTRNIKIHGVSTSLQAYIFIIGTATVDVDYVEFYFMGSAIANKRGFDIQSNGDVNIAFSSFHEFLATSALGPFMTGAWKTVTITDCNFYDFNTYCMFINTSTDTTNTVIGTFDNNIMMRGPTACISIRDFRINFRNNVATGTTTFDGVELSGAGTYTIGVWSGNVSHSNGRYGLILTGTYGLNFQLGDWTIWRNGNYGMHTVGAWAFKFSGVTAFGNANGSISITSAADLEISNLASNGDSTYSTPSGVVTWNTVPNSRIRFFNANLSTASGIKTAHTTDVAVGGATHADLYFYNSIMAAITEVSTVGSANGRVSSQKHDQTAGLHKSWLGFGIVSIDTVIFDVLPSTRLTPSNANNKLEIPAQQVYLSNGQSATISAKVRESVAEDGTAYNGNRIRLIAKKNPAIGINADTVVATATAASNGAFESISGTTPTVTDDGVVEISVDCDGTTGWVNIDTITVTGGQSSGGQQYWINGLPGVGGGGGGGGGILVHQGMAGGLVA